MVMLVNDGRDFFDRLLQLIQNEKGVLFGVFAAPGQSDSAKHAVLRRQVKPQDWAFTMPGTSSRTTYLSRSVNNGRLSGIGENHRNQRETYFYVRIDPLFQANAPARVVGASVTFEPCARTAWHIHPLGQTLIVTAGCGRVQRWGGPIEEIRPGDVIWFSPGEKHWHGATPTTAMTHIAIQEQLDGKTADWMEKVSDEQYQA